jgi:hypothetical protein
LNLRCLALNCLNEGNFHLNLRLRWLSTMLVTQWFAWLLNLPCLALNCLNERKFNLCLCLLWLSTMVVTQWFAWLFNLGCLALNCRNKLKFYLNFRPQYLSNVVVVKNKFTILRYGFHNMLVKKIMNAIFDSIKITKQTLSAIQWDKLKN